MNLDEFIKETLINIKRGVITANAECANLGDGKTKHFIGDFSFERQIDGKKNNTVKFDVGLMVSGETKGDVGGSLKVFTASFGSNGSILNAHQTLNRIQFEISIKNDIYN